MLEVFQRLFRLLYPLELVLPLEEFKEKVVLVPQVVI
jgi:hypothetical protein